MSRFPSLWRGAVASLWAMSLSACGGGDAAGTDNASHAASSQVSAQGAGDGPIDAAEVPSVQATSVDAAGLPDDLAGTPTTVDLRDDHAT